ncbi:hypothetical protein OZX61_02200 [Acinetobacter sp. ESL0695]|nr:hypothetical protein [Acinetobacter sp. ESL0695]WEV49321.1 hypothetical protein OZX61_02200 [Acinetobacter sp. ESL0695]
MRSNSQSASYSSGGVNASIGQKDSHAETQGLNHINSEIQLQNTFGHLNGLNIKGGEVSIGDVDHLKHETQKKSKRFYQKVDIVLDGVAHDAKYPIMLSGSQLNRLFNMVPKVSSEYDQVQKLVRMQDQVSKQYQANLYASGSVRKYNSVYVYPRDSSGNINLGYIFIQTVTRIEK